MKKLFCFLAMSCLGASCVLANIGETYKQSCARYGKPDHRQNGRVVWYINRDFSIIASFDDPGERCDTIAYESWAEPFREDQLLTLLWSNTPSANRFFEYNTGAMGGRFFATAKNERTALLMVRSGDSGRNPMELSIWTLGKHQRVDAAEKAQKTEEIPAIDQLPTA